MTLMGCLASSAVTRAKRKSYSSVGASLLAILSTIADDRQQAGSYNIIAK